MSVIPRCTRSRPRPTPVRPSTGSWSSRRRTRCAVAAEIASLPGRTLFFVRTKYGADRLAKQLARAGVEAAAIHGDRNQNQRQRALDAFAAGHPRVLVATDVAARGIHVDDVDLVVQFDPPNDHKDYLHRSGRTARAGAAGMVIALVERGQVRELQRLHDAAGVTAASDEVDTGHHVVREIAASGTPVPPKQVAAHAAKIDPQGAPPSARRSGRGRPAASARGGFTRDGFPRDGFARGTGKPGRRRPQNADRAESAKGRPEGRQRSSSTPSASREHIPGSVSCY